MKIVYVVGARPNFVKMAPVLEALTRRLPGARHVLVHTGQHYDRAMSDVFFDDLDIPPADHVLGVGSGSHAYQTARIMEAFEDVVLDENPDLVIVPGDVNSTLAATLVAAKLCIPLAHLEAGLRSFDRRMPEEINRIVADEFADHLFVHSDEATSNLRAEGISTERIHFVGNTMIDTLVRLESRFRALSVCARFGLEPNRYLVVTLHRPAVTDTVILHSVVDHLEGIAGEIPIVFPLHPRTRKMLGDRASMASGVQFVEPLGYLDFLSLESDAAGVLTDSGGIQEETTYLGIPCFTLRDNTERPVTVRVGRNIVLGLDPRRIDEIPGLLYREQPRRTSPPPGWDGAAAERVADVLAQSLDH